jgi:hypothetical protein
VLDDVLQRMTAHHYKKTALLRSLRSWHPDAYHKQQGRAMKTTRSPQEREDAAMQLVDERLTGTFAGQFGADTVRAAIDEVYQQFHDVSVRDFVPLLTERRVRQQLSTATPRVGDGLMS